MYIIFLIFGLNLKLLGIKNIPFTFSEIIINSGKIIIKNEEKVALYNKNLHSGKFLIKGRGWGTNNAQYISDIACGDNFIGIYDSYLNRISIFNLKGEFVNSFYLSKDLVGQRINISKDGIILNVIFDKENYLFYHFSLNGEILKKFGKRENYSSSYIGDYCVDWKNKKMYFPYNFREIKVYDFNGNVIKNISKENWLFLYNLVINNNKLYICGLFMEFTGENDTFSQSFIKILQREIRKDLEKNRIVKKTYIGLDIYSLEKDEFLYENLNLNSDGILVNVISDTVWTVIPEKLELRKYFLIYNEK